ncbi:MAG: hypothetical protein J5965_15695 [Aeriscardovia sp.]|nr:hypothetical protein [Aeriscardovia sp.]
MVNSSSLFHFTRDFETLKQILAEGLRFNYCYEPFGEIVAKQGWDIVLKVGATIINCKGIAIPMICFCDIPLLRTQKHREKYGNYMIGFNREVLVKAVNTTGYMMNPVQYRCCPIFDEQIEELSIQKDKYIAQIGFTEIPNDGFEIRKGEKRDDLQFSNIIMQTGIREKNKETVRRINAIDSIIGFSKPYKDACGYDYMEEREWRIIIPDCNRPSPNLGWLKFASKEQVDIFKLKLSDNYPRELYLLFDNIEITTLVNYIVVSSEMERNAIIYFLNKGNKFFGYDLSVDQRTNLLSKITSFEQIERDY